jgi:hypothetical protein
LAGKVVNMGEEGSAYEDLVRKSEENTPIGRQA